MKVTKKQFGELPKWAQAFFKAVKPADADDTWKDDDAGEFDNGEEDAKAIKGARDKERNAASALKIKNKELEDKIAELEEAAADAGEGSKNVDEQVKSLKDRHKAQIDKLKNDHQAKVDGLMSKLQKTHVTSVAKGIATELFIPGVSDVMTEAVAKLLGVNLDGDEAVTEVLGPDGKPTAETLQELKEKVRANPAYAAILIGSKGSGSGAGGGGNGGGAFDLVPYLNPDKTVNWTKVHEANKADPTVYKKVQEANLQNARTTTPDPGTKPAGQ